MLNQQERLIELSLAPQTYNAGDNVHFNPTFIKASQFRDVLTTNNYSAIIWKDGYRKESNFIRAGGFFLDIDKGMSVEEAISRLEKKKLNYSLITTKSHTYENNRFRIFIPFSHRLYSLDRYQQAAHKINEILGGNCDPSVFDGARFLFGSPEEAYYSENWAGSDFEVKGISTVNLASVDAYSGDWDDTLVVKDSKGKMIPVTEISEKTQIHCPFHDDNRASAFIDFSDRSNNWFIHCSACDESFWKKRIRIPSEVRMSRYWSYSKSVYEVGISGDNFYFQDIGKDKFYILINVLDDQDKKEAFDWLVKSHHISKLNRVDVVGSPDVEAADYNVDNALGIVTVRHPLVKVDLQDNQLIEDYLDRTFGEHKKFIKEYMAVYTYTNYEKLPTVILTGSRGVGKNTFADLVANIYAPLSVYWKPDEGDFNPELQKKLLIADETVTKDVKNYTYLKRLSGQSYHLVNEKHVPKYQVRNNINIIILSNRHLPIFTEREELPHDSANNQFFVFEVKKFSGDIDRDYGKKLARCLGHYVRTELKRVFDGLDRSKYRYSIEVPITSEELRLFNSSVSTEEAAADRLLRYVAKQHGDNANWEYKPLVAAGYLPLDKIYDGLQVDQVQKGKVLRNLREREFITPDDSKKRMKGAVREYCYAMTEKFKDWLEAEVGTACVTLEQAPEQAPKNAEFSVN